MNVKEHYSKGYRFYLIDGVAHASNTSVLKLLQKDDRVQDWAIKQTLKYIVAQGNLKEETISNAVTYSKVHLNELAEEGTNRHNLAADYLQKGAYVKGAWIDRFIKWEKKENFVTKPELVERFAYNTKYRIAGRIDLMGYIMGEPVGVDIKTSSGIYMSHKIQCCGYNLMLKKSLRWAILNIPRDASRTSFKFITEAEMKTYTAVFISLTDIFRELWKNGDLKVDIAY